MKYLLLENRTLKILGSTRMLLTFLIGYVMGILVKLL